MTPEQMLFAALGVLGGVIIFLQKKQYTMYRSLDRRLTECERDRREMWRHILKNSVEG